MGEKYRCKGLYRNKKSAVLVKIQKVVYVHKITTFSFSAHWGHIPDLTLVDQ